MWYLQVTWDLILTLVHFDSDSPSTGLDRGCDLDSCLCSSQVTFILDLNLSQVTWDPITGTELLHLVSCRPPAQFLSRLPEELLSDRLFSCISASPMLSGNRKWSQVSQPTDRWSLWGRNKILNFCVCVSGSVLLQRLREEQQLISCFYWSALFLLVSLTNVNWTQGLWRTF